MHARWVGGDLVAISLCLEIFRARIECGLERIVFGILGGVEIQLALPLEHPRHRISGPEISAVARQLVPHLGNRSIRVVGHGEDENGNTARTVTLVCDFLILDAFELACAFLDCALDVVLWHRCSAGGLDCRAKARIAGGITSAKLGRHGDFADELREMRAALCVSCGFVMLDLLPLTMSSH